jgi:hypothetical protein
VASLADRRRPRVRVAEGDDPEAVPAARRDVPERDRDSLGDIGLAPIGRAEAHRRGRVEDEPRDEHPLGVLHAHVRLAGSRRDVPVDLADVVAGRVRTDLRELAPVAEQLRAVVAGEQPLHPASDGDVQRVQQPVGERPRPGPSRSRRC